MLIDLQRVLQRALASDEPLETLRQASRHLPPAARATLDRIDPEGLVLTSLLVRKLRFERLCSGDRTLEAWFDRDPAGFTGIFRAYNRAVPPREYFPREEARAFFAYLSEQGIAVPSGSPS